MGKEIKGSGKDRIPAPSRDAIVTDIHQVSVTETTAHQEVNLTAGGVLPRALSIEAGDQTGKVKATEIKTDLAELSLFLSAKTGHQITNKTARIWLKKLDEPAKEARRWKRLGKKLVDLVSNFANAKKKAIEQRYVRKHTENEIKRQRKLEETRKQINGPRQDAEKATSIFASAVSISADAAMISEAETKLAKDEAERLNKSTLDAIKADQANRIKEVGKIKRNSRLLTGGLLVSTVLAVLGLFLPRGGEKEIITAPPIVTPTPSEAGAPGPEIGKDYTFYPLKTGDSFQVEKYDLVLGKLEINGIPNYSNQTNIYSITYIPEGIATVTATKNATDMRGVIRPNPGANYNGIAEQEKQKILATMPWITTVDKPIYSGKTQTQVALK